MVPVKGDASGAAEPGDSPVVRTAGAGYREWRLFFHDCFPQLVMVAAIWAGNRADGEEAAAWAMRDVWQRWSVLNDPRTEAFRSAARYVGQLKQCRREDVGLPDAAPRCEDAVMAAGEVEQLFHQLLTRLAPAQRSVLSEVVGGLSPTEIARLLGNNRKTMYQRLCAVRQSLQADTRPRAASPARTVSLTREEIG